MSVAQLVAPELNEDGQPNTRWHMGTVFQPDSCDPASSTTDSCPVGPDFTKPVLNDGLAARGAESFTVYSDMQCSPAGGTWEDAERRVVANLTNGEARAVEEVFWTGNIAVPSGAVIRPHLAEDTPVNVQVGMTVSLQTAATVLVSGAAVDIVEGVGLLEAALRDCYGAVGVIHAPFEVLEHAAAQHIVRQAGQKMLTFAGTPVAFGSGYPGTSPSGAPAPAGHTWLYATGAVMLRRDSSPKVTSGRVAGLSRSVNTLRLIAERTYNIAWDCCHFAVLVSLGGVITGSPASAT